MGRGEAQENPKPTVSSCCWHTHRACMLTACACSRCAHARTRLHACTQACTHAHARAHTCAHRHARTRPHAGCTASRPASCPCSSCTWQARAHSSSGERASSSPQPSLALPPWPSAKTSAYSRLTHPPLSGCARSSGRDGLIKGWALRADGTIAGWVCGLPVASINMAGHTLPKPRRRAVSPTLTNTSDPSQSPPPPSPLQRPPLLRGVRVL